VSPFYRREAPPETPPPANPEYERWRPYYEAAETAVRADAIKGAGAYIIARGAVRGAHPRIVADAYRGLADEYDRRAGHILRGGPGGVPDAVRDLLHGLAADLRTNANQLDPTTTEAQP
jgi:hypothetical protein